MHNEWNIDPSTYMCITIDRSSLSQQSVLRNIIQRHCQSIVEMDSVLEILQLDEQGQESATETTIIYTIPLQSVAVTALFHITQHLLCSVFIQRCHRNATHTIYQHGLRPPHRPDNGSVSESLPVLYEPAHG